MNPRAEEHVAIEIHDSELVSLEERDFGLVAVLEAYVHRSPGRPGLDPGTGWSETAHIHVGRGLTSDRFVRLPMRLEDGSVETPTATLDNTLPTGRVVPGPVRLILRGFQRETVVITGDSLEVRLQGNATYIEDVTGI